MYERPGYRSLIGRIRSNVRTYIRKQLELPRQEIAEILAANKRAAMWLGAAAGLAGMVEVAANNRQANASLIAPPAYSGCSRIS